MPELPEVEVTRRGFAPFVTGAQVVGARLGKPLRWPLGAEPQSLVGTTILGVRRRGKYLLIDLDRGILMLHLGMSGRLVFERTPPPPGPHDHFDLMTTAGTLRLHDPRRFGAVILAGGEADPRLRKLLDALGVEPLEADFEPARFAAALRGRRTPIKQVLLSGNPVVGVGNIYASEALFLAGIRPTTPAARVGPRRAARLHAAIREVLSEALALGGSSLRDFAAPDGRDGHFQVSARVYGREGQPCRRCGTAIRSIRQGQRSSFFCPACQRA